METGQPNYRATQRACYLAFVIQAIIINLSPLLFATFQRQFQLSFSLIGQLIFTNFLVQLVVDAIAARYADRIGARRCLVFAHLCCGVGLILIGILPRVMSNAYTGLCCSTMLFAIGGGFIEVLGSPLANALPSKSKETGMALLHSFYSWGQLMVALITTLLIRLIGDDLWYLVPFFWALFPLYNALQFSRVPLPPPLREEDRTPLSRLFSSRAFWLAFVLMLCSGSAEQVMAQWGSLFAEKGLGVSKVLGDLLGPCLFGLLMGIGRTAYGLYGQRFSLKKGLIITSAGCVLCYLTAVWSAQPFVALLACALTGITVSLMWPGVFSLASMRFPTGGTALFGFLALAGDVGCAVGPWLAGFGSEHAKAFSPLVLLGRHLPLTADQLGLKTGLLLAASFPFVLFVCLLFWNNKKANKA